MFVTCACNEDVVFTRPWVMAESSDACLVLKNDSHKNGSSEKHTFQFTEDYGKLKSAKYFRGKLCLCNTSAKKMAALSFPLALLVLQSFETV